MEAKDQQSQAIKTNSAQVKEEWAKPQLVIKSKNEIEADPTTGSDALAAGLFS